MTTLQTLSDLRKRYPESWLLEYIEKAKSGEEIIGNELMLMLDILLGHFENPTAIFPDGITYDTSESDTRIKFIETKVKHFEAPFAGKPFILTLRQKAYIEAFYSFKIYDEEVGRRVRLFQERIHLVGRKCGKALSLDTPIITINGWSTMGEVKVGDYVFGRDGKPTMVIQKSDIFKGHKCYEVEFEDGEIITADADHIWNVMTKNSRKVLNYKPKSNRRLVRNEYRAGNGYFNITTKEMATDFAKVRQDGKGTEYKYRVPMNLPVEYPEKELPVHPYILGVWLGDGDSDNTRISCHDDDFEEMRKHIEECGYSTRKIERKNRTNAIGIDIKEGYNGNKNLNRLREQLREIGVFQNKHIPEIYMRSSIEQRRELLKGLMDTDGTIYKNQQCEFSQSDKGIIDSVSELLFSLGIKNSVKKRITKHNNKEFESYRVFFHVDKDNTCFKLKRKHDRLKEKLHDRMKNKSIIDIREIESVDTQCLKVSNADGLFLAGKNYTVTHNTPLEAAMDLAEFFCGEMGTRILCSSNDYEQAGLMFDAIDAMREESPSLEKVTRRNQKGIFFGNPKQKKKRGKFSKQNKGYIKKISAKTGSKEGKNIKVGSADEIHELKDNSSIMPIRQALSTQDEPIFSEITTEGFVDGGYLDERLIEARQVLKGELHRPRWLIWLHTQDSEAEIWQDEKTWVKSNPDLGVIKKWRFLRQMVEEAKTNSATRAFVLAKDFNIKQAGGAAWLQDAEIINTATFDLEDFRGSYYIAGCDFAETTDLTAVKLLMQKPGDPAIYFWSHYWIPEEKLKLSPDDADYRQWERDGYLTIVPGGSVDSSIVADWQWELYNEFGLIPFKSGYDNRFAKDYIRRHEEYFGKDSETVNVPQEPKVLNNPTRRLESDLRHKLVNYNNRYGDYWCFRNCGIRTNNAEKVQLCKLKTTHRIDGADAAVICYAVYEWYKSEFQSLLT